MFLVAPFAIPSSLDLSFELINPLLDVVAFECEWEEADAPTSFAERIISCDKVLLFIVLVIGTASIFSGVMFTHLFSSGFISVPFPLMLWMAVSDFMPCSAVAKSVLSFPSNKSASKPLPGPSTVFIFSKTSFAVIWFKRINESPLNSIRYLIFFIKSFLSV